VLRIRPLRWIGRVSYGAYVLHDIPHPLYLKIATKFVFLLESGKHFNVAVIEKQAVLVAAVIAFGSTLVLAWLSFRFFESPFLNLKERWTIRSTRTDDSVLNTS
jgi:peptidoglycan/LPS O-acetylase OafA/YrhL